MVIVSLELAAFHDGSDIGYLVLGQAELTGQFCIGHAAIRTRGFDLLPVQFANRIATPHLYVMAHLEDGLAVCLDHLFRHTDLAAFEATGHYSASAFAAIRVS